MPKFYHYDVYNKTWQSILRSAWEIDGSYTVNTVLNDQSWYWVSWVTAIATSVWWTALDWSTTYSQDMTFYDVTPIPVKVLTKMVMNWEEYTIPNWAERWDITGTLSDQTDLQTALNWKQATLVSWTNIKTINSTSILWSWNIDTNQVSDTAYASSWDWVTTTAPSKNAVYDKISSMDTTISNKANTSDVLTKTNTTEFTPTWYYQPATKKYVDDNISAATWWAVSDEAYGASWDWVTWIAPSKNTVYDKISSMDTTISWKQATLVSWTNIKTVNWNSLLGSGDIEIWWAEYNAWKWIEIWDIHDYSAMQWPAPDGFHVPLNTERQAVKDIRTALGWWSRDWTNFWMTLKIPMAGYRYNSSAGVTNQGTGGYYWSSSRYSANYAYYLYFSSAALSPQGNYSRASGFSVRCFKNSPTIPTSSWTKLYWTSIEAGWIFWSSTDWLISLSSNWQNWITIADKNLWATTVWNSWDTLSEANCGKYYQRWNNYWFPRTWTIANQSTTQVDASSYWPWNYYSSDTFIKYNWRWDTTDNANLRWWETWVVTINNAITNTGVTSINGQTWDISIQWLPSGWTVWQVLQMTANWPAWVTLS